jgi:hypothetical protein
VADLEGYYTRHGNILELLQRVDDRIVIANAGDETSDSMPISAARRMGAGLVLIGDG